MFIHWGVYSTLGGIYKNQKIPSLGEWIMYHAKIPRLEYREIAKTFNPVDFNAEAWVLLAKEAGMKYMVAMTKHHDGFSMYKSDVSRYNIYDLTPFKRDPIDELYKACQKHGIRLGLYYSHSIDWMDGGDAGNAQYKKAHPNYSETDAKNNEAENEAANIWDPSPLSYQEYLEQKAKPQMREILKKFPNLVEIWYDYPISMNLQQSFDFYKLAYELQPKCLINKRVGNNLGDILTAGDNEIPARENSEVKPFETPGTLNDTWGYKSYDQHWKSHREMLYWIAEIASKGGNYLLNVGPDGKGIIPIESVKILKEIGAWMKVNGEAIYGTHPWTIRREGDTGLGVKGRDEHGNIKTASGKKMDFNFSFTPNDFWFTAKENVVYAISLTDAVQQSVSIKSFSGCINQVKKVYLLGSNKELKWKASDGSLVVNLPADFAKKTGGYGFVLKVQL
jgi:alpha-L-fucosidase